MRVITSKAYNGTESIGSVSNETQNSLTKKFTNTRDKTLYNINNKFVPVWLDSNVNDSDSTDRNSIARLQRISALINTFTDVNECLQSLTRMKDSKILMILADSLVKEIYRCIRSMTHIHSIYIITDNDQNTEYSQ
ncbi:unnamed protein product [Rotaria sp. Silwood1]|nr:unnamed protein product [Rotaria sp. Silwood1]